MVLLNRLKLIASIKDSKEMEREESKRRRGGVLDSVIIGMHNHLQTCICVRPWRLLLLFIFFIFPFSLCACVLIVIHVRMLIFAILNSGFIEDDSPYASSGKKGTYYFEFSRSLRTMDRLQQVQNAFSFHIYILLRIIELRNPLYHGLVIV